MPAQRYCSPENRRAVRDQVGAGSRESRNGGSSDGDIADDNERLTEQHLSLSASVEVAPVIHRHLLQPASQVDRRRERGVFTRQVCSVAAMREIQIRDEMIRLGQFLKLAGLVDAGSDAKQLLANGRVRVDGEVETRRGRQLQRGNVVEVAGDEVRVG